MGKEIDQKENLADLPCGEYGWKFGPSIIYPWTESSDSAKPEYITYMRKSTAEKNLLTYMGKSSKSGLKKNGANGLVNRIGLASRWCNETEDCRNSYFIY